MRIQFSRKMLLPTLILVYSMNFMDRSVLGIVSETMKQDMGFSDAQLGVLHSILLMAAIFLYLPGAILNDVWKRRKLISLCTGLWGLAMAGTAAAGGFFSLLTARLMGSLNECSTSSGATAWIAQVYPESERSRAIGIFEIAQPLGMALGMLLGTLVLALTGNWRVSFALFVIPAFIAAFLVFHLPDKQPPAREGFFAGFPKLLKKRTLLITGCAAGFYGIIKYSNQAWMPVLLIRTYSLDVSYAGPMAACFLLAGILGPFVGGMLTDFWGSRSPGGRVKSAAFWMALILISKIVFYALLGKVSLPIICIVGVVDGILLMTPIPAYVSIVQDVVEDQYRGSAVGIFGVMLYLAGGAWGPLLVGLLSDAFGGGAEGLWFAMVALLVFALASAVLYFSEIKIYQREKVS